MPDYKRIGGGFRLEGVAYYGPIVVSPDAFFLDVLISKKLGPRILIVSGLPKIKKGDTTKFGEFG